MKKATKICKICGKEYSYCFTLRDEGPFRWQDVACCPEHGSEYFAQVLAARSGQDAHKEAAGQNGSTAGDDRDEFEDDDAIFADDDEDEEDELDDYWYEEEFNV